MNEKITFPRLASLLADRSGRSKRFSEDFLREFFALIGERLEAGENVKVKGLGTFRLSRVEPRRSVDVTTGQPMEITGHTKVVFVPAKELAEAVNAPFEAFPSIEISEGIDISQIFTTDEIVLKDETDDNSEDQSEIRTEESGSETTLNHEGPQTELKELKEKTSSTITTIEAAAAGVANETASSDDYTDSDTSEGETYTNKRDDGSEDTNQADEEEKEQNKRCEEESDYEEGEYEESTPRKRRLLRVFMISFGAAMVALIATLAVWYIFAFDSFNTVFHKPMSYFCAANSDKMDDKANVKEYPVAIPDATDVTKDTLQDSVSSSDEAPEVPTAPSDAVVYDTIGTTRYLTTMAKSHYGNYNLWPYIYEENKSFLGHPDRIRPGTPVVIPKLSKYGVDPTNKEDIEKAKKMGVEIYARFGKKIQ